MKWQPAACRAGDVIRVRLGSIYHYGIFVSEAEVIQFGLPPVQSRQDSEQLVCRTDIDTFCCGSIVEVACPEKQEKRQRFSSEKTVERARARLGEGGYNLIHNNCEHFVNECAFGVKRCTQEEEARARWNRRPILDIYIGKIPSELPSAPLIPEAREQELRQTANEALRLQRYATWRLLELGASHSFGKQLAQLQLQKNSDGKWIADGLYLSLSHTDGAAAAAVSNGAVGIDIESQTSFLTRHGSRLEQITGHILNEREVPFASDAESLLHIWTKKESIFKCSGSGVFRPADVDTTAAGAYTYCLPEGLVLSVSGEKLSGIRIFIVEQDTVRLINPPRSDKV